MKYLLTIEVGGCFETTQLYFYTKREAIGLARQEWRRADVSYVNLEANGISVWLKCR